VVDIPLGVVGGDGPILAQRHGPGLSVATPAALSDTLRPRLPQTRIPLADEAAPIFDVQVGGLIARPELPRLISVRRPSTNVHAVVTAGGQFDLLAFRDHSVGFARTRGRELKFDAVEFEP